MRYLFFLLLTSFSQFTFADTLPYSSDVLFEAKLKAKEENKNILLMFTASWCIWCKKMDKSIQDPACKKFFDENYVVIHLNVQETDEKLEHPGSMEFLKLYHGEASGIPFWVVLDSELNLLADSYMRKNGESKNEPGENLGCPASEEEVNAFISILKETAKHQMQDIPAIEKRFRSNKN